MPKRFRLGGLATFHPAQEQIHLDWSAIETASSFKLSELGKAEIADAVERYHSNQKMIWLDGKDFKQMRYETGRLLKAWNALPSEKENSDTSLGIGQRFLVQFLRNENTAQRYRIDLVRFFRELEIFHEELSKLEQQSVKQARSPLWDGLTRYIMEILEQEGNKISVSQRSDGNNARASKTELFFRSLFEQASIREHLDGDYALSHALAKIKKRMNSL